MGVERWAESPQWYVLHTHLKQEERANENLRSWGVETLHAKLRTRRYNEFTGATTYITQPLFPRYLFARFNAREQLPKIQFTRGVHYVVCFGESPAPVDQVIIDIVRDRIDENGFVKEDDELKLGDKVVVSAGPLRNLMGIFERAVKGSDRITILLTAIEYQGRLVVNRDIVQRAAG
ncbi:MAG TPA: transcription termination/antitermination NusG family protein [Pyrinomonadaceae bacterium]|nr:transcription termination/antitermination NusG family protein [Pyrinomonadaceae bacterium]